MESLDDRILRQAGESAGTLLRKAVDEIDGQFGNGFAERNPELVGAFMRAAVADSSTYAAVNHFGPALERAADALERIADGIGKLPG